MKNFNLDALLEAMLKSSDRVSDLNFSVGRPPQVEVDGQLAAVNFPGLPRLTPYQTEMIAMHMLRNDRELTRILLQNGSVDLSYSIPQKKRFRVNIFAQRGTYAIVLRAIPESIPSLEGLKLPKEIYNVSKLKNGIVLVTGPTGSGKSTALAAEDGRRADRSAGDSEVDDANPGLRHEGRNGRAIARRRHARRPSRWHADIRRRAREAVERRGDYERDRPGLRDESHEPRAP